VQVLPVLIKHEKSGFYYPLVHLDGNLMVILHLRSPESPVFHAGDERRSVFGAKKKKTRREEENGKARSMLICEYKVEGTKQQYLAIDEAIRIVQLIRNTCLRLWMDTPGTSQNDLQCLCAALARDYSFAGRLNSQARQAAASRAWFAISRFYKNCQNHKPGKKGYPQFQHNNRSVECKTTGWKLDRDGKHITFTDGCGSSATQASGSKCFP
jgi:hypothetical protein